MDAKGTGTTSQATLFVNFFDKFFIYHTISTGQISLTLWLINCCKIQRNNHFDSTNYLYIQGNNYQRKKEFNEIIILIRRIVYIFNEIIIFIQPNSH